MANLIDWKPRLSSLGCFFSCGINKANLAQSGRGFLDIYPAVEYPLLYR